MSTKRKPAQPVARLERGGWKWRQGKAHNSYIYFTTAAVEPSTGIGGVAVDER